MLRLQSFLFLWFLATTAASADESVTAVMSATFKIANKSSSATCFIIGAPAQSDVGQQELILLTAAHVFEKMSGDECHIVLRKKRGDGTFLRDEVTLRIRSAEKPLWVRHSDVDVAAIRFQLPSERSITALDLDQIAGEPMIKKGKLVCADEVWIPGYPAQLEANSAGFPVLRQGTVASFPLMPINHNKTYLVDSSTFGGDSGAPVLLGSGKHPDKQTRQPIIVGLVIGHHRETTKTVTPIEERTVHRPLGLAIVVHGEFIRQTVDLLRKSQEPPVTTARPRRSNS
jgi:hypothetical protein